mmetsp:Transcript_21557/g.37001  ORF Transcript_21557/g.37001 Transcript_21557/m.37001 type:complete len:244 (+) Transcript_21557:92-823(+)
MGACYQCITLPCRLFGSLIRVTWILINLAILVGGILVLAVGSDYLTNSAAAQLFASGYTTGLIVLGSAMIIVGGLGFLMGCTEIKIIIWIYSFLCNFVMIPLAVLGILLLVFSDSLSTLANSSYIYNLIYNAWVSAVSSDSSGVCDYQTSYSCSGFSSSCSSSSSSSQCPSDCSSNSYTTTCYTYVINDLEKLGQVLGAISVAFGVVMFVGCVVTWVLCCCPTSFSLHHKSSSHKKLKEETHV